ncbi:helix-turn-helix domain-containing protein [Flavobacterium sp. JP2137]|uniref:helix-turn-helix domain-containing protein n=1 Tax=Flavobacterium sp. JP2137 TaxID=3414510 RepID=UPI003D301196
MKIAVSISFKYSINVIRQVLSKKKNISIFHPFDFKNQFVDFAPHQAILRESVNDFFIHALNDKTINLRLPLPPHKKTVNDFFIVTEGFAKRQVGINAYKIHKSELLSVPQLQVSTTDFYSENLNGFYCHFSDDFLVDNSLLLNWQLTNSQLNKTTINEETTDRIYQLLTMMNNLYRSNWTQNKKLIAQYLRTVITEINFQKTEANQGKINKKRDLTADYIGLINANLDKAYNISELAEMLHITPNHLNKTIKKDLGKSAQTVYNEILLQEAKVLLLQTSKDISEIAFDLGFSDLSYFGKFFKKLSQQSPLEYRRMIEKYQ